MTQGIERIETATQELVGRIVYIKSTREWERRTLTYPFGARVVVERAAQAIRHTNPMGYEMLMAHSKTIV